MSRSQDEPRTRHQLEGEGRKLEYELEIEAPREAVWNALTEGEELERWFPFQARVEPGEGGKIWMSWDGRWESANEIRIWEPGSHLRTGWDDPGEPEGSGAAALAVDYHLEGEGGRTVLRLVHHGFSADADWDEMFDGIRRGWAFELQALRHYLELHRGTPRRVVRVDEPLPDRLGLNDAWNRLVAPGMLGLAVTPDGGTSTVHTAAGDRFEGRTLLFEPPRDAALATEGWNRALFRLGIERCGGPNAPIEAMVWLETWGVPEADLQALEARLGSLLRGAWAAA